jgi:hypothetical protein
MTRKGPDMSTVPDRAAMAGSGNEAGVPRLGAADCAEEAAGQTQAPAIGVRTRLARRTARRARPAPSSAWPRPRPHGGTVRLPGQNRITRDDRGRPAGTARCGPPVGGPADRAQRTQRAHGAQTTRHDHNVTLASSVTKFNNISMLALTNNCLATNAKHNRHAVQSSLKVTGSDRRAGCYLQQTFSEFRA